MIKSISSKACFLLAVTGAAALGVVSTTIVAAAVPSVNDGQIHACYLNNASLFNSKGTLRVVDNDAGQTCTTSETSLAWSVNRVAYVNFNWDPQTSATSVASKRDVDSVQPAANGAYCVKVGFTPKTSSTSAGSQVELRGLSVSEDADIDSYCDSSFNALIMAGQPYQKVTFFN